MSYQITSFRRNDEQAKRAGVSLRIAEKGAYQGRFTRAELIVSDSGATGVEFQLENKQTGQFANYLTIWTHNAQGDELAGAALISALLVVMKQQECVVSDGTVDEMDRESRQMVKRPAKLFGNLMGKPVGVFLVREEYTKNDGSVGDKMLIVGCFDPMSKLMPKEIIEGTNLDLYAKTLEALKDRVAKPRTGQRAPARAPAEHPASARGQQQSRPRPASGFDDMDDDIPF